MEDNFICLDLYPEILKFCNYKTLMTMKNVNSFCYNIYQKENKSRLKSMYPFGEKNAKIKVILKDILIDRIICILDDHEIEIPPNKYSMYYVADILKTWFIYSFSFNNWILTGKIFKSMIRIMNKDERENAGEILIFAFKDGKSYLSSIFLRS